MLALIHNPIPITITTTIQLIMVEITTIYAMVFLAIVTFIATVTIAMVDIAPLNFNHGLFS